jgi:protein O-mannosyl-transferase
MSKKKKRKAAELKATESTKARVISIANPAFSWREHRIPLLILALLAFVLYIKTTGFEYALDDKMVLVDNKFTQEGFDGIADIFRYESFRGYFGTQTELLEGDRYRPLSIASFAAEKEFFGAKPAISHFFNVLLYVITGLVLYRVLVFMFPVISSNNTRWYFSIPFIATALYIVHPLHVEVVANIKGRDEILAMLGEMGTLFFSFKWLANKKTRYLFFSFISFFAAILSKEGAITFLAVVPLTVHFFSKASLGEKLKVTVPVLAGTILYLMMRVNAIGYLTDDKVVTDLMNNPFYGMSFGDRTATIFYTLLLYLKLLIFPDVLTHDYYPYQIPVMSWSQWQPILSLLIHAAMAFIIIKGWKKRSSLAYSFAFYIITLSIVSNLLVSVGIFMNERFVYHASLGFCIAAALGLNYLFQNKKRALRYTAVAVFILMLAGYSVRTVLRLPAWKNDESLDKSAIKNSPNSARANCFYGISIWQKVYLNIPQGDIQRRITVLDSMSKYFDKSIAILPDYKAAQTMRAGVAGEYHKIRNDYGELIRVFEGINESGVIEPFVVNYLNYVNGLVGSHAEAEKLAAFYERMVQLYSSRYPNGTQAEAYRSLKRGLEARSFAG